jgi:hypothetical protein
MYKLGTMIFTATLIVASAHAEETMPSQSALPEAQLTSAANVVAEATSLEQETQSEAIPPQSGTNAVPLTGTSAEIQKSEANAASATETSAEIQKSEANTTPMTGTSAEIQKSEASATSATETSAEIQKSEASATSATETSAEIQTGFNPGTVARSVFTTAIADREPVDTLQNIEAQEQKVYYFTELLDMQGQTATHRWEYNGEVIAEIAFEVKGPRWRVWSSKKLPPESLGEWKVSVLNSANEVINENTLNVVATPATESAQPPAAPAVTPQ